jgi:hypothetical protein
VASLAQLARGKPFWPWEWDRYHARVRALRLVIQTQHKQAEAIAKMLQQKRTELLKQVSSA